MTRKMPYHCTTIYYNISVISFYHIPTRKYPRTILFPSLLFSIFRMRPQALSTVALATSWYDGEEVGRIGHMGHMGWSSMGQRDSHAVLFPWFPCAPWTLNPLWKSLFSVFFQHVVLGRISFRFQWFIFSCIWCVSWFLNPHVVLRRRRPQETGN